MTGTKTEHVSIIEMVFMARYLTLTISPRIPERVDRYCQSNEEIAVLTKITFDIRPIKILFDLDAGAVFLQQMG